MAEPSSWFLDQLQVKESSPVLKFSIMGSDHSSKVLSWPSIKRDIENFKPTNISLSLTNIGGEYTTFYSSPEFLNSSCSLEVGFNHPVSGDELIKVFTGIVKNVSYPDEKQIQLQLYDKIHSLAQIKIGGSNRAVVFSETIPSEIMWTVCTCYGQFSSVRSTSNIDIDYASFLQMAASFSADTLLTNANFENVKCTEALQDIANVTDSFIWSDGDGKVIFDRASENSSLDFLINEGEYINLKVSVDATSIINKQHVSYGYNEASDTWYQISMANTTSINSFGLYENIFENENVYFPSSIHAGVLANRMILKWGYPPRRFKIKTPLFGINRKLSETIRFVNSYWGVNSSTAWRIVNQEIDLDPENISIVFGTNEGTSGEAFYLDVSSLDGNHLLL